MERAGKRTAAAASLVDNNRPSKKQKTPPLVTDNALSQPKQDSRTATRSSESVESTYTTGLEFTEALRRAQDKNGRLIATAFLSLPDPKRLPDYYRQIELPISIDTIEAKLKKREYSSLTAVESDIKRMVLNAKQYNESKSEIFQDAERVRKMTYNHMSKVNPAYHSRHYQSFPTPLPSENGKTTKIKLPIPGSAETPSRSKQEAEKSASENPVSNHSHSANPSEEPEENENQHEEHYKSFEGKTFQQAQEQVITEIMQYEDQESGLKPYSPFATLPSKSLQDYYRTIKSPMSMKILLQKIRGTHSRSEVAGMSAFKTWDSLEAEASKIWENAREYNEDDSEMFALAGQFENLFKRRLQEAKKAVPQPQPEPQQQRTIKLNMPPNPPPQSSGLKLTLSQQKSSPAPAAPSQAAPNGNPSHPSISVDQQSLSRQRERVQNDARASIQASGSPSFPPPDSAPNGSPLSVSAKLKSSSPGVADTSDPQSRPPNHPMPSLGTNASVSGGSQYSMPGSAPAQPHPSYQASNVGVDGKWRQEGRDVLLPRLDVRAHPDLQTPKPLHFSIPYNRVLSQQHITLTLPAHANLLRLQPELGKVLQGPSAKPSKLFVTANNVRIPRQDIAQPNGASATVQPSPEFDVRLLPGLNRIEVETLSISSKPNGLRPGVGELEMEKISLFVFLLKG